MPVQYSQMQCHEKAEVQARFVGCSVFEPVGGIYKALRQVRVKLLTNVITVFDRALEFMAILAAGLLIFMMLLIGADVILRYFLNSPIGNVLEVTEHILLAITFLGAPWVLRREAHVSVDLLLNRLNLKIQALVNLFTSTAGTVLCLTLTVYGARITWDYFQRNVFTPTTMRFPLGPMMAIIFVSFLLLFLQFARRTNSYLRKWRTYRSNAEN